MVVHKHGQTINGRAITSNFEGHKLIILLKKEKGHDFFSHRELNRYPKALTHLALVGPEEKCLICKHNILRNNIVHCGFATKLVSLA